MQSVSQATSLLCRLGDADVSIRRNAVRELLEQPAWATGLTTALIRLVSDRDEMVRHGATECLERIADPGSDEVADLTRILRETCDGETEYWAATMLGRIGPQADRAVGALASVLLDSSCLAARERAAWALGRIGPAARMALNALRQIGQDDPPRLRRLAEAAVSALSHRAA